jgi:acyl carrier protein
MERSDMTPDAKIIHDKVKEFILKQFLPGEDADALADDTAMMDTGILDSLAILKLITYLEEAFGIRVEAHEADAENMNTLADITRFVSSKLG